MIVGDWVRRGGRQKWHRVESVIAEAAITRCGRRMEPRTSESPLPLQVSPVEPLTRMIGQPQNCRRCS